MERSLIELIGDADVDRILQNVEKDFQLIMSEKNIRFIISAKPHIRLKSDEARIGQVLSALLYNSVDFVPKDTGLIEITAEETADGRVVFFVRDNGPGIPEDKKKYLFQKFYQVDTSLKRKHGGTGLGLAITHRIIQEHNGTIEVESEIDKGSIFRVYIPIKEA